jgi:hypothetical protein
VSLLPVYLQSFQTAINFQFPNIPEGDPVAVNLLLVPPQDFQGYERIVAQVAKRKKVGIRNLTE